MDPTPGTSRDFRLDYSDEINDLDDYLPEERQAGSKSRDCSDEEGEIDEIENYKPQPRDPEDPADPVTDRSDDEVEYVMVHISSIDSNTPISDRIHACKMKRTLLQFKCSNKENFVRQFVFMVKPRPTINLDSMYSLHKFLKAFFTEDMVKIVVEETNKYPLFFENDKQTQHV